MRVRIMLVKSLIATDPIRSFPPGYCFNCIFLLGELETYLDPMFGEGSGDTDRVKQECVLLILYYYDFTFGLFNVNNRI